MYCTNNISEFVTSTKTHVRLGGVQSRLQIHETMVTYRHRLDCAPPCTHVQTSTFGNHSSPRQPDLIGRYG